MAQVDPKLTAALKQAKTTPMFFVFVSKGNEGMLLVDKKKINSKDAAEAKKKCGGGTIHKGRCKGEEGVMVFEVGKDVSPTIAALTKKIVKRDAGLIFEVEYRCAADLAAEESQGESADGGGNPTAAVAPPPAAPSPQPQPAQAAAPPAQEPPQGGAEVMKRLNAMTAGIKAAMLGPNKARVQALFVSVNKLIKDKDFAGAGKALDELGPLVVPSASAPAAAPASPQAAAPSPPAAPADDRALAAEWKRRMIALEPMVLQAQKTRAGEAKWMMLFMSAQDLGSEEQFEKALAVVQKLEGLLIPPAATPSVGAEAAKFNLVALQKARLLWIQTRQSVRGELQELERAILEACKEEPDISQITTGSKSLYDMLEVLDESLLDALDDALNADTPQKRTAFHTEAREIIQEYTDYVDSEPLLGDIDSNGFTNVKVRTSLTKALADLSSNLN